MGEYAFWTFNIKLIKMKKQSSTRKLNFKKLNALKINNLRVIVGGTNKKAGQSGAPGQPGTSGQP